MTLCMDKMHFMMKANTRFGHSDALLIFDIENLCLSDWNSTWNCFAVDTLTSLPSIGLEGIYSDE